MKKFFGWIVLLLFAVVSWSLVPMIFAEGEHGGAEEAPDTEVAMSEDTNGNGVLDEGEDLNGNGILDLGEEKADAGEEATHEHGGEEHGGKEHGGN